MRAAVTFIFVLYIVLAGGMMGLAVPLIRHRVKPNFWYGVRLPETLRDETTWYRVNAQFGKWFFGAGAVFVVAAVGLYFTPHVGSDLAAYCLTTTGILLVALTVALVAGLRSIETKS